LGKGDSHSRRIAGDPAAPPFLGDKGSSARAASWVEHEIAGICRHKKATLQSHWARLDDVNLLIGKPGRNGVIPKLSHRTDGEIGQVTRVAKRVAKSQKSSRLP